MSLLALLSLEYCQGFACTMRSYIRWQDGHDDCCILGYYCARVRVTTLQEYLDTTVQGYVLLRCKSTWILLDFTLRHTGLLMGLYLFVHCSGFFLFPMSNVCTSVQGPRSGCDITVLELDEGRPRFHTALKLESWVSPLCRGLDFCLESAKVYCFERSFYSLGENFSR
jgi:hypothetical protein